MFRMITVAAVLALTASAANAQMMDKAGKCRDAKGHFMKAGACTKTMPMAGYKLDAKGNCHDPKGKMAKKDMCAAK